MKKYTKYITILIIISTLGAIFYNKVYIPKTTYDTVFAQKGDISVKVFGIGNVGAKNIYNISAQTGGEVLKLFTDEGEWVKKGNLIAILDPVDLPQLVQEAKISVKKASSELIASQKELDSLKAQETLAQITYERYSKLKKQAFASQSEYDKAKADLDVIQAQIKATKARIKSAKIEITRTKKTVEAREVKLSRYKIYSPIDGYVISKEVEVAQSITSSQTIYEIVDPKTVWIKAYIDEKLSGNIRLSQSATITLRSQRENPYKGSVKRIVAKSDAVTQEKEVDIIFNTLPIPFYINEQAEILISIKEFSNIIKIPVNAVVYKHEEPCVWVEKKSKAHCQNIKIIARDQDEVGVSSFDITNKILIMAKDKKSLSEGMRVH